MASEEHEPVHVFAEWDDGPRSGLATFRGRPHLYESLWRDDENDPEDDWALVPVDPRAVSDLLERLRPLAHDAGAPTLYPGSGRHQVEAFTATWQAFKVAVLACDAEVVRGVGDMRPVGDASEDDDFGPLEVCWTIRGVVSLAAVRERLVELDRQRAASLSSSEPPPGEEMAF